MAAGVQRGVAGVGGADLSIVAVAIGRAAAARRERRVRAGMRPGVTVVLRARVAVVTVAVVATAIGDRVFLTGIVGAAGSHRTWVAGLTLRSVRAAVGDSAVLTNVGAGVAGIGRAG